MGRMCPANISILEGHWAQKSPLLLWKSDHGSRGHLWKSSVIHPCKHSGNPPGLSVWNVREDMAELWADAENRHFQLLAVLHPPTAKKGQSSSLWLNTGLGLNTSDYITPRSHFVLAPVGSYWHKIGSSLPLQVLTYWVYTGSSPNGDRVSQTSLKLAFWGHNDTDSGNYIYQEQLCVVDAQ